MDTTPQSDTAPEFSGQATYCPEDNKLRLYVGRVPREEYLALKAEGWQALHKQRETGGGDFAAGWTPERRDTALEYAGVIEDEDKGPAERATDRAERFALYREKRTGEALGQADRFDAGPSAHGYQSQARAERSARRHDAIAGRAVDSWSKAEYWHGRTAGVISHALHKVAPAVRMGRIKVLEADLRRFECSPDSYPSWIAHTKLRLAYENQMLEAVGGRAALVEMQVGGWIGGRQIRKVVKSPVTGQVVSVEVMGTFNSYRTGSAKSVTAPVLMNVERSLAGVYTAPTPEDIAAMDKIKADEKAARPKVEKIPLINPTDADAERLQALMNENMLAGLGSRKGEFAPSTVLRLTQSVYSANSKGSYSRAGTKEICANGVVYRCYSQYRSEERATALAKQGPALCSVRLGHRSAFYSPDRVIVITDKPQKPLPVSVWQEIAAELVNA